MRRYWPSAASCLPARCWRGNGIALLSTFLVLLLYFLVPWTAVNLVDYFLVRKGRYAIPHFFTPKGIYGAWQARGIAAYLIGFASMVPFFHIVDAASGQAIFVGYVAQRMHGVDIAWLVGLLVAGSVYLALVVPSTCARKSASSRASATATWRRWPNTSRRSSNERASHPSDPVDPGRWRRRRQSESGARPHRAVRRSGGSGGLLRNIHPGFPTPQNVARLAEPLDGPSLSALRDAARQAGVSVAIGLAERDGERFYNTAVLIDHEGGLLLSYRKTHLYESDLGCSSPAPSFPYAAGTASAWAC